jgi:hypothetical protein
MSDDSIIALPVSSSLRSYLTKDAECFKQWQKSTKEAWIFLDSVDEAKIRRHADFHAALDRVRDAIAPTALKRTHKFISSRISEWQPEIDRTHLLSRLGPVEHRRTPEPVFRCPRNQSGRRLYWSFRSNRWIGIASENSSLPAGYEGDRARSSSHPTARARRRVRWQSNSFADGNAAYTSAS